MKRDRIAANMMRRLCAFPSFRPAQNPDTERAYIEGISKLIEEFGCECVYDAITAAIERGGAFAPSVGDLRGFIAMVPMSRNLDSDGGDSALGEEGFYVANSPERQAQIDEWMRDYGAPPSVEAGERVGGSR